MSLFKKKEEKSAPACCCGGNSTSKTDISVSGDKVTSIKVLGAGCKSCHEQYEIVKKAALSKGLDVTVEYITDMEKVMTYGVMSMPAIVINEKVVSSGKVVKAADVEKMLN